uniref:Uncharacterized protein n=1 Tax=Rhizophora mucronata TaxID=61149 RepID=A0A2P2IZF1_RHIMU
MMMMMISWIAHHHLWTCLTPAGLDHPSSVMMTKTSRK